MNGSNDEINIANECNFLKISPTSKFRLKYVLCVTD